MTIAQACDAPQDHQLLAVTVQTHSHKGAAIRGDVQTVNAACMPCQAAALCSQYPRDVGLVYNAITRRWHDGNIGLRKEEQSRSVGQSAWA